MVFEIIYSRQALKVLKHLSPKLAARIRAKIVQLAADPFASNNNVTALKGEESRYRLRIGSWRVIYEIDENQVRIDVVRIAPRGEAYR